MVFSQIRPILLSCYFMLFACSKTSESPAISVSTQAVNLITAFSGQTGGTITCSATDSVSVRGVCWSTTRNPTTAMSKTVNGGGRGTFSATLIGLLPSTLYYIRAYSIVNGELYYGNELSFTTLVNSDNTNLCGHSNVLNPSVVYGNVSDNDGHAYRTVKIGNQTWMAENLKTTRFSNGDAINALPDSIGWIGSTSPAWVYYKNDDQNDCLHGKLYNWSTAVDNRNVCPTGWHVPTLNDWNILADSVGGKSVAGKLKCSGEWAPPNFSAENGTGFSALPSGYRDLKAKYVYQSYTGVWWTTSLDIGGAAYYAELNHHLGGITLVQGNKKTGYSIRCVKD